MRIGFDIRPLLFTRAGIHTYLYNLIVALAKQEGLELALFGSSASDYAWKDIAPHITETVVRLPHLNRWFESFWQEALLPRALARSGADVFHGARFFLPRRLALPAAVTIHDCAFKRFAGLVSARTFRYFDAQISHAASRSSAIIVPSDTTRDDLVSFYGVRREKISVIHEATAPIFSVQPDALRMQSVRAQYGLDRPFILCVSTIEPRKNLSRLLAAYQRSRLIEASRLVIVGNKGWLYEDVFRQARRLRIEDRVVFAGFVSGQDLSCLYRCCEVFVFPSLYEGFGLPVLEAMQSGAAVVASDTASLAELFGQAYEPVDPLEIDSIAAGMERVFFDDGLRARLRVQATQKAAQFSWEKAARETAAVYAGIARRS